MIDLQQIIKESKDIKETTFQHGSTATKLIGYRVMRYDPNRQIAISGADGNIGIKLIKGETISYGQGHFLTNDPQYAIDYYGQHEVNVLLTVEFDIRDVLSGDITDKYPEISVSKSVLLDYRIFKGEE